MILQQSFRIFLAPESRQTAGGAEAQAKNYPGPFQARSSAEDQVGTWCIKRIYSNRRRPVWGGGERLPFVPDICHNSVIQFPLKSNPVGLYGRRAE